MELINSCAILLLTIIGTVIYYGKNPPPFQGG